MRCVIAAIAVAGVICGTTARAENRLFILATHPDSYGVDDCLTTGAACGKPVADSYCRSHNFARAVSFRKVDRDDITGAIPADDTGPCTGGSCQHFVAIQCSR